MREAIVVKLRLFNEDGTETPEVNVTVTDRVCTILGMSFTTGTVLAALNRLTHAIRDVS